MARIVLIVNAEHDEPTAYLGTWSRKVVKELQGDADIKIIEIGGIDAVKTNVLNLISSNDPAIIIFNGHGNENTICGHNYDVLVKVGEDLDGFKGRIVHAMACKSASVLGGDLIKIGGVAFVGYKEEFKLVHQGQSDDTAREADAVAALFLNPAFTAVTALMKGETASQAYALSQHEYAKCMAELIKSNPNDLFSIIGAPLYHNMKYQVCLERT